ncbi:MAG: carotenoid oxygenase family protein [Gammaproteobacteria bacterium]|nr:carotenoid oxygenase family protein [Gammaproteobacteria bacterium]
MQHTELHTKGLEFAPEAPFGEDYGPMLMGPFAPVADESVWDALEVIGEIPADLNGVYLRNGPNPRFAPQGRYHPFDGDGMIHAAHFERGRVVYRNRWVRTDAWLEEDRAGRATFHGIRETLKGRTDKRLKDASNTDVIGHGGVALASWYMSGDIYKIDPVTLETLGKAPYAKRYGGGFSAHPKVDAHTGELMFFDYWNEAPYMSYGVVAADGTVRNHVPIELPGPRLPHDMAITEHYSILHDLPLLHDEAAMALGRHKLNFHPEMATRFGVIPRYGASDSIRWFEFSPCFLYHTINAWEDGDEVVMVGCRYMPDRTTGGAIDAPRTARNIAELKMNARLWRWRMNLRTGEGREEQIDDRYNVEFPSMHAEHTGRKTRWGYLVDHHPEILHWTGIRKFDTDSGECVGAFSDGAEHTWYSEAWFAAADNAKAEDDGYVVVFAWNEASREQQLQVFDARDLSAGPIARVRLPRHVPSGFHACWMPQASITAARQA